MYLSRNIVMFKKMKTMKEKKVLKMLERKYDLKVLKRKYDLKILYIVFVDDWNIFELLKLKTLNFFPPPM